METRALRHLLYLAMSTTTAPTPTRKRNYTPSEFSALLAKYDIGLCTELVRFRCALPSEDPRHIRTIPALRPRYYIPDSEVTRLLENAETLN